MNKTGKGENSRQTCRGKRRVLQETKGTGSKVGRIPLITRVSVWENRFYVSLLFGLAFA